MKQLNVEEAEKVYERAMKYFGARAQIIKTMEECGELIQALAKSIHKQDSITLQENLMEELIDVQIMIFQITTLFDDKTAEQMIIKKTNRLAELLGMTHGK